MTQSLALPLTDREKVLGTDYESTFVSVICNFNCISQQSWVLADILSSERSTCSDPESVSLSELLTPFPGLPRYSFLIHSNLVGWILRPHDAGVFRQHSNTPGV